MALSLLDMHRIIEQDVQKMGFFAYKDLEPEEIDIQINKQIDVLVTGIIDKFFGRQIKINEQQGFQRDQVSLDNLRTLHKVITSNNDLVNNSVDKSKTFSLPPDYRHLIKGTVIITYKCYDDSEGKEITKEEKVKIRIEPSQFDSHKNPYRKTGRDSVLAELIGSSLIMYYDSTFDIANIKVEYIKNPISVKYVRQGNGDYDPIASVQTDLDSTLHYMLVNMTSIKIMEILEQNPQKIVSLKQETI